MERKNWIWAVVAALALAALGAGLAIMRAGPRSAVSDLAAPPIFQQDSQARSDSPTQSGGDAAEEAAEPGVLDVAALYARISRLGNADGPCAYPVEQARIVDADTGSAARFDRTAREALPGQPYRYYSGALAGTWLIADGEAGELRLLGGVSDTMLRFTETYTAQTVPAFVIACGDVCLRVEGDRFTDADSRLATRWAQEPDTGFWYTVSGGRRRYLNADGLGDRGVTRWRVDDGVLRGTDADGEYSLIYDGGWMLTVPGAFCIADAEGRCLNIDASGVLPDTEPRTRWVYDDDLGGPGGYFRTYLDGRRYTLSLTDGALSLSTDPYADYWLYQDGRIYITKDGGTYGVACLGGVWQAEQLTGWRISDGERYLSAADGAVTAADAQNAAVWQIESAGPDVVISTRDGVKQYLGFEGETLLLSDDLRCRWQRGETSLRCEGGALGYAGGWTLGTPSNLEFIRASVPAQTLSERVVEPAAPATLVPAEDLQLTERGEAAEVPTGAATCIPIQCDADGNAAAENPGYLCAGDSPLLLSPLEGIDIDTVYTRSAADEAPRRIDPAAEPEDLTGFPGNYARFRRNARAGLYGLRLTGRFREDAVYPLPLARFGGQTRRDCELPGSAIDLRLTASGTVSFFAADCADGLFALYSVERDPDTGRISAMRRIERIYRGREGNVYDYAEGGLPVREDAELLFDTAWLRGLDADALYYFELPLNAGEIALCAEDQTAGALLFLAVSEQSLQAAPEPEPEPPVWDALSDRSLLTFLRDPDNAAALGAILRSADAGGLIERAGRIADDSRRHQAAELLDALRAEPAPPDWRAMTDADFVPWLCDPANRKQILALLAEDREGLAGRVRAIVSHEDYFRAREQLVSLIQAG